MGHIKEPKGVDFLIESEPLTNQEKKKISEFIQKRKELSGNIGPSKKKSKRRKTASA